ncbi:MAG: hypothetical protein MI867_18040 [Pseudomonadales bacterium]|nr:hypothetical protein [Pseudomonadales bacterium]
MNEKALKNVLLSNAMFSVFCGILLIIAAEQIANLMGGHPEWIYLALGVGLILFAADVAFVATRKTINPLFAKMILWADIGWVVASIALLAFAHSLFSMSGLMAILAIAAVVGLFGVLEHHHMKAPTAAA